MKISEAMLKGYAKVGKQAFGKYCTGDPRRPTAVCAAGAANYALRGKATDDGELFNNEYAAWNDFTREYGFTVAEVNDNRMPIEDIAGMLRAIGH